MAVRPAGGPRAAAIVTTFPDPHDAPGVAIPSAYFRVMDLRLTELFNLTRGPNALTVGHLTVGVWRSKEAFAGGKEPATVWEHDLTDADWDAIWQQPTKVAGVGQFLDAIYGWLKTMDPFKAATDSAT